MILPFTQLHIRPAPAALLLAASLIAAAAGLSDDNFIPINDKLQHFLAFFLIGIALYWVLDVSKRRATQVTGTVLFIASVVSEYAQATITTRLFDPADILANLVGSGLAMSLNIAYHGRMLQRKRTAKYAALGNSGRSTDLELGSGDAQDSENEVPSDSGREADNDAKL